MTTKTATLLVVEDDDVDYKLLMRSFSQRKISDNIIRAKDGLDALEKIKSGNIHKPFLVLVDLNMPRMNGKEFLHEIRKDLAHADTVVFLMTTSNNQEDIINLYSNNVAGYFLKDNSHGSLNKIAEVVDGYWQISVLPT